MALQSNYYPLPVVKGTTAGTYAEGNDARIVGAVQGAASSASDVLGVSGANITGVDANADRIIFFDDSAGKLTHLTVGSGLSISDTTISATATGTIGGSTGATDNAVLRADGTGGSTSQGSAFVIADNATASPNNTVNHASIQATGDTTNVSVSIVPKGTGALSLHVPDAASTGGNARGTRAVDLQRNRNAATQVASGTDSFIAAGNNNTASGDQSFVAGTTCSASAFAAVALGWSNTSSNQAAFTTGRESSASATFSEAHGVQSTANASTGFAFGSRGLADRVNLFAHGANPIGTGTANSSIGGAQRVVAVLTGRTKTSATAELQMFVVDTSGFFTIPSGKAVSGIIRIVGATSGLEGINQYMRRFLIKNRSGTTALVGTVTDVGTDVKDVAAGSVSITADDVNDRLKLEVTGYTPVTGCTAAASTDVISKTAHGFSNNDDIIFTSLTGGAGLTVDTVTYWVIDAAANTFKVSATRGGAAVNITTDYTDMTANRVMRWVATIDAEEVIAGI